MFIEPNDPNLRRLHGINQSVLDEKKQEHKSKGSFDPVSIHPYTLPNGAKVLIVVEGTHRVQAAIELELDEIEYELSDEKRLRAVVKERGRMFDDLMMRCSRFESGQYE